MASWQALAMVALVDVCLICLQLGSLPPPDDLPVFYIINPIVHPQREYQEQLLKRVEAEQVRVKADMMNRVRDIRNITEAFRVHAGLFISLDAQLSRLESVVRRLQGSSNDESSVVRTPLKISDGLLAYKEENDASDAILTYKEESDVSKGLLPYRRESDILL